MISIASEHGTFKEKDVVNAKVALSQKRITYAIYLSKEFQNTLLQLLSIESKNTKEKFELAFKLSDLAVADLNIKTHNFISNLAAGEPAFLRQQYKLMAKKLGIGKE